MNICSNTAVVEAGKRILAEGAYDFSQLVDWVVGRMWRVLQEAPEMGGKRRFSRVVVFAGTGRTAAVALGLAERFSGLGSCDVTVELAKEHAALCAETLVRYNALSSVCRSGENPEPGSDILIIDGLLGAGARVGLDSEYCRAVEELNELRRKSSRSLVVAVDMPTGMEPDAGRVEDGGAVRADVTLAVGAVRPWMTEDGAEEYIGALYDVPLPDVPGAELPELSPRKHVTGAELVRGWLNPRPRSMHKYQAGKVTVVAGSEGMVGAAQMCAEGALAAGAGLVTLYCPRDVFAILATRVAPEVMVRPLSDGVNVRELVQDASRDNGVLVAGSGVGQTFPMRVLREIVERWPEDNVMVLDAGGLVEAFVKRWKIGGNPIFTPHAGELRKMDSSVICPCLRMATVGNFLQKYRGTLLYKGARTIIADGAEWYVNGTGGPWMAGAGQGDILAGVIGGLAAQGLSPVRAAALAACVCGLAATDAWRESGYPPAVRATALLPYLPGRLA